MINRVILCKSLMGHMLRMFSLFGVDRHLLTGRVWHYRPFDRCRSGSVWAGWHSRGARLPFRKKNILWPFFLHFLAPFFYVSRRRVNQLECWLRCSPVRILTAIAMATKGHRCDICAGLSDQAQTLSNTIPDYCIGHCWTLSHASRLRSLEGFARGWL
jgi:hypothetical protein